MKLIVPCAGRSSRYPNMPPKWILPDHEGVPMVVRAVEKLSFDPRDLVVTILGEHEQRFNVRAGLAAAFGHKVTTVVLDHPTQSQSETVAKTLRALDIHDSFLVKDSDNSFQIDPIDSAASYVSVASLNDFDVVNPRNKSYVTVDQEEFITSTREKRVISDLFSVGGYYFRNADTFLNAFDALNKAPGVSASELYISEIISYLLLNGEPFKIRRAQDYNDWGTVHEWRNKLESQRLFFVSVDGFVFERGSAHFSPNFAEVKPNPMAVQAVQALAKAGHQIIYLSIRPQNLEAMTKAAIAAADLPDARILMACEATQWTLVTSPHPSMPLRTARARELAPDEGHLIEKLLG